MVNFHCEMFFKFKTVLILLLLTSPFLGSTENVRRRGIEKSKFEDNSNISTLPDQLAIATSVDQDSFFNKNDRVFTVKESTDNENESSIGENETPAQYVAKALRLRTTQKSNEIPQKNSLPQQYEVHEPSVHAEALTNQPAQESTYQKDSVTRTTSYDIYDEDYGNENGETRYQKPQKTYTYSNFHYEPPKQPQYASYGSGLKTLKQEDDTVQGSSSEIPKAEILKHIEESVVKYMKTLEAEGKLPIKDTSKAYQQSASAGDSTRTYSTVKVKESSPSDYQETTKYIPVTVKSVYEKQPKYQQVASSTNLDDLNPQSYELVYKTKTRSQPQYQPQQQKALSFDHAAALKNLEGFDLSDVMPHEDVEKPKLYFNSQTYHDINSLPYKPEKSLGRPDREKLQSYYENVDQSTLKTASAETYSGKNSEDGYPLVNPYKYYINPQPPYKSKLIAENNLTPQPADWQSYIPKKQQNSQQNVALLSVVPYDSYNPKYNNNPETYGYQHNFKSPEAHKPLRSTPKRGKRGGHKKPGRGFNGGIKDHEANLSLRPPPPYKD